LLHSEPGTAPADGVDQSRTPALSPGDLVRVRVRPFLLSNPLWQRPLPPCAPVLSALNGVRPNPFVGSAAEYERALRERTELVDWLLTVHSFPCNEHLHKHEASGAFVVRL